MPVDAGFAIDWEATSVSITVSNATYVGIGISDETANGARFALYYNNTGQTGIDALTGDPNNSADASPNLRVQTFLSSSKQFIYPLASRGIIAGETATYTVVLLTEPQFIGDKNEGSLLVIQGFWTDGVVLPAENKASCTRRIELMGDSLTAGYGSGFDAPPGTTCGAGVLINDVQNSYGALLCQNFSAECHIEAVSGITLFAVQPNLPEIWNYTLGSMYGNWPAPTKQRWDFSSWVPDAVIINLGENDWNFDPTPNATFIQHYTDAYVAYVQYVASVYNKNVTFFLTIAPHEKGQSVGILPAVSTLQALNYKAHFLNATVAGLPIGCGGHPGPTVHRAAFEVAQPIIASIMGW
jgi:lysophospholipase L1-like esterase